MAIRIIAIALSLVLAGLRIGGVTHIAFQAAAHLWVGFLLCAAIVVPSALAGWAAYWLTVVETYCVLQPIVRPHFVPTLLGTAVCGVGLALTSMLLVAALVGLACFAWDYFHPWRPGAPASTAKLL